MQEETGLFVERESAPLPNLDDLVVLDWITSLLEPVTFI